MNSTRETRIAELKEEIEWNQREADATSGTDAHGKYQAAANQYRRELENLLKA